MKNGYYVPTGDMRAVVYLQTYVKTYTTMKSPVEEWVTQPTPYRANIRTPTGRELLDSTQMKSTTTHVITMRWPGFLPLPNARIINQATQAVYNITTARDPDDRHRFLVIFATRRVLPVETP